MARKLEDFYPPIREDGIVTDKNASIGGTLAVTGASTLTGNVTAAGTLAVTGTSAFTGVATFTAAPVYSGGQVPSIISGSGATVTLTAAQSGSTVLLDRAAGIVFTLPTPAVGLNYTFLVKTTVTTNSYKVITNAGSVFIAGSVLASIDNTANKSWVGDGATHIAVTQAAANTNATGGIIGSYLRLFCLSTTLWQTYGLTVAGGTPTTPFATS